MKRGKTAGRAAMPARTFFIDSENNIWKLFEGMELLTSSDAVVIFHRDAFPKNLRSKLETTPAQLEWIKCVDAGVKNSMDVQLIAEFAMRVAKGTCRTAYIVSEDNGFSPAIHYLQRAVSGEDFEMAHVKSIETGIARSIVRGMEALKVASSVDEVRQALTRVYGVDNAAALTDRLGAVFAGGEGELPQVEKSEYNVMPLDDESAEAADDDREAPAADGAEAEGAAESEDTAEATSDSGADNQDCASEQADASSAPRSRKSRSRRSRKSSKPSAETDASVAAASVDAATVDEATAAASIPDADAADAPAAAPATPADSTSEATADAAATAATEGEAPLISLKGIGKTAVAKLAQIGIETPSQLREAGAVKAWTGIKALDESFAIRWLYAFDAAIEGIGPERITRKRRAALKSEAEALLAPEPQEDGEPDAAGEEAQAQQIEG